MTDARTIKIDPRDYRLDKRLLARIWRLIVPYWSDRRHWKSWLLMAFGILIGQAWGYYNYWVATVSAEQANALVTRNGEQWKSLFWLVFLLGLGQWVYGQVLSVLNKLMSIQWYRWMTNWMTERYLENRTYYDIALKDDIDNPDERIQDNVEPFTETIIGFPLQFIAIVTSIITNSALMSLSKSPMTGFVFVYSFIAMILQTALFWPLIRMNFNLVASNADFRYGLLRLRDNAETIAFFRGENMERRQVGDRLDRLIRNKLRVFYYTILIGIVTYVFEQVWTLAPLVFIYPLYFSGKLTFGTVALITGAASTLRGGMTSLNSYIPMLAGVAPRVVRLAQIVERNEAISLEAERPDGQILFRRGEEIALEGVSFETPGGEQKLARDVSLRLKSGQSLVISGQTGVGKSSILRAMAGLWSRGSGTMEMPAVEDTMFVPQKPYMMLGDLRAQLLYPHGPDMSEDDLQAVLDRVCLPGLIRRFGGISAEIDWGKTLSLGEQQRISFARVLISRPRFVFLDEATSAVDVPTEALLYRSLVESGVTFISVGHRETILQFHDRALILETGGRWKLVDAATIAVTPIEQLGAARDGSVPHESMGAGASASGLSADVEA